MKVAVVGAGRNEGGLPCAELHFLTLYGQHAAPLEDDVHLVVGVRLLMVGLGSDEHVHADLEPGRLVDDLVPTARFLEPPPGGFDL